MVDVEDAPSRLAGRPIFLDYATNLGTLGLPADARGLRTVGAAGASGQPEPYAAMGPPLQRQLESKPDMLAFDLLPLQIRTGPIAYGGALAAAFAAGQAALEPPTRRAAAATRCPPTLAPRP
jgi:hypothetical protein